ncbi:hypothetical protein BBOV_II005410 [Babesia bovis T2Bo]|uniref:hypothetical protein n=1 Tax=Babesia bovis T2Bo TaxID=484906 RepID=UPI001C353613|nr:hypothetical protein BBOV_II005410 [Babesia bovis T2Bo]EDO06492.2 hypothetical protein BBOV_II005410 [Babesia bovis T2Bo]
MVYLTVYRAMWARLPRSSVIHKEPMLLHLYAGINHQQQEGSSITNNLESDNDFKTILKEHGISCYIQNVSHIHPNILTKLDVKTVPIVLGVFNGEKIGEYTPSSTVSCAINLCKKIADAKLNYENKCQSEHKSTQAEIDAIIAGKSKSEALSELTKFESSNIHRLEFDDVLRKLLAQTRLRLCWGGDTDTCSQPPDLNVLRDHIRFVDEILAEFTVVAAEGIIASQPVVKGSTAYKRSAISRPLKFNDHRDGDHVLKEYNKVDNLNVIQPVFHSNQDSPSHQSKCYELHQKLVDFAKEYVYATDYLHGGYITEALARLVKIHIMQNIGVLLFLEGSEQEAIQEVTSAYEDLVHLLKCDQIDISTFQKHHVGRILELMFTAMPWDDPAVLIARATLETIDGPRLLNRIPERTRPLGGPVSKRRGFGGRYSWQGPDYRPKKYRPREPDQYLNEWRYQADANLPTW